VEVGGEQVAFESCIIATGSAFRGIPGVPLDGKRVISSREAFELEEMPESVAIIGGGAIGCEFASFFAGFGTKVTMVVRRPILLPSEDEEAAKALLRAFRKRGITVLTSSTVEKAEAAESGVTVTIGGEGAQSLECDLLLSATGRLPSTKGLEPEKAGVSIDERGFVVVDDTFRTARPHIFAVGDCIDTPAYAHTAAEEGRIAARNLIGGSETNLHLTPSLIFSHPQLASCGLSEREAAEQGRTVEVRKAYFKANSKAKLMGDDSGVAKVLVDPESGILLGATITGVEATEIIHELLLAIEKRLTLGEVKEMIHGHPTVSEIVRYL
jgi:dihydrolipoamide dehydrogenase